MKTLKEIYDECKEGFDRALKNQIGVIDKDVEKTIVEEKTSFIKKLLTTHLEGQVRHKALKLKGKRKKWK